MNRTIALFPLLMVAACSRGVDQPSAASLDGNGQAEMQRSIDEMTLTVRLKAAEGRIVELEKQVGALQATPEKVENQLLTQRLEQLEARVYALPPERDAAATPPARGGRDPVPVPSASPTPTPNRFNPFGL